MSYLWKGNEMSDPQHQDSIKCQVAECSFSLATAIQNAGGSVSVSMLDMSVKEFIATVAGQNHIRFVYSGPAHVIEVDEWD